MHILYAVGAGLNFMKAAPVKPALMERLRTSAYCARSAGVFCFLKLILEGRRIADEQIVTRVEV
jgi:hypothetical protein